MARSARWVEGAIKDGYGEVKFYKWEYFVTYINAEMLDYPSYVWRGHRRDDWRLESTYERMRAKNGKKATSAGAKAHLEKFKYASLGRRGSNPPNIQTENDWWALGQHHGLATPLLDWTQSPFTSAYFAFMNDGKSETKYRAIFALHKPAIEAKVKAIVSDTIDKKLKERVAAEAAAKPLSGLALALNMAAPRPAIEFVRPLSDENQRLVNQGGLFTRAPVGKPLEDWVRAHFAAETNFILMKLLLPSKDRVEALRMLNRMNINHSTLFPDLYGASRFCNTMLEISRY